MKKLKKLLALVLVAVMVLSVGAIGASAAFTDTASSNYQEAIDVLAGIGVINGTTSTTYEPTGSLTRAAAAKVITYLQLGPLNAGMISTASSQTFSDVPTSNWASGYVDYCASQGIISGTGDGTFNPNGTLTTIAFAKMLLVALGYNADIEGYVGSNWAVNIASDALTAGVADYRIPLSASTVCTRDQAAQLAFKALTAKTVRYTGGSTITVGDTTITTGATMDFVQGSTEATANYNGATGDGYMQFCEKYFPFLKLTPSQPDSFGRPAHMWMNASTLIGLYKDTAAVTYNAKKFASAVATDLSGYKLGITGGSKNVDNVTKYETGTDSFSTSSNISVKNGGTAVALTVGSATGQTTADAIAAKTGNGKLVEIYADPYKNITAIVETEYTVSIISNISKSSDRTIYTIAGVGAFNDYVSDTVIDTIYGQTGMVKGATITYVNVNGTAYVYPTTKVVGTATNVGYYAGFPTSVTIDGTAYNVGSGVLSISSFTTNTQPHDYYIDQYGFVVKTDATAAYGDYAYIIGSYASVKTDVNGTNPAAQFKVVKADGTVAVYDLALSRAAVGSAYTNIAGSPVTGAAGDYILTGTTIMLYDANVTTTINNDLTTFVTANPVVGYSLSGTTINVQSLAPATGSMATGAYLDNDVDGLYRGLTSATDGTTTTLMTSGTTYVVYNSSSGTAAVYNGNSGLPTSLNGGANVINNALAVLKVATATTTNAGTASVIFATVAGGIGAAETANYAYVNSALYSINTTATGSTYTYTGYKADGTFVSLTTVDNNALDVSGVYTYTAEDKVADGYKKADTTTTTGAFVYGSALNVVGTLLNVGGVYYNITDATQYVYVDATKYQVDGNNGFVVLDVVNGAVTTNVETIYIIS